MNVTIWHARGCVTANLADDDTLTNYPSRAVARLILDEEEVEIRGNRFSEMAVLKRYDDGAVWAFWS